MKKIIIALALATALTARAETVHYITLKFSQSTVTTKRFYDSVNVGQELGSRLRAMPFYANIGKRKVTVSRKFTREDGPNETAKRELQVALAMGMEVIVEDIDNSCRIGRNDTGGRSSFGFRTEDGTHGADRTEVRRNKKENEKMKKATKKPVLNVKKSSAKTVTNKRAAKKPAKKAK